MEGISFLNSLTPWSGGKFDLDIIKQIASYFDSPQDTVKTIHVAGTNGKGSFSSSMASVLNAYGYSVGLNISPHLNSFCERISVNGKIISLEELNKALLEIKKAANSLNKTPSYHEAITLAYFLLTRKLDWSVLEVGLGGRLDASNIIERPEIAVITSIGFDHESILGNTLEKIAFEKAGIIKNKLSHLVLGKLPEDIFTYLKNIAKSREVSHIRSFNKDFQASFSKDWNILRYYSDLGDLEVQTTLKGEHQASNLACVIDTALLLGIDPKSIKEGLTKVVWPCRLEKVILENSRVAIIDAAHNEDGVNSLISFLDREFKTKVELVFGAINTKNWRNMLKLLIKKTSHVNLIQPSSDQAVSLEEIENFLSSFDISFSKWNREDLTSLIKNLSDQNKKGDLPIVFTGSLYLVGSVRANLLGEVKGYW